MSDDDQYDKERAEAIEKIRTALPQDLCDWFDAIEVEIDDANAAVETMRSEHVEEIDQLERALSTVRYWLHDFSYFHRMTHSAQEILTIVERAL